GSAARGCTTGRCRGCRPRSAARPTGPRRWPEVPRAWRTRAAGSRSRSRCSVSCDQLYSECPPGRPEDVARACSAIGRISAIAAKRQRLLEEPRPGGLLAPFDPEIALHGLVEGGMVEPVG